MSKTPKLHNWEYKLPIIPTQIAPLSSSKVQSFLDSIYNPAARTCKLAPIPSPPPIETTDASVAFFDSAGDDPIYYGQNNLIVRWRQQPERFDLTAKNRGTNINYNPLLESTSYPDCNNLAHKEEYGVTSGSVVANIAFDNEFKSNGSCDFNDWELDQLTGNDSQFWNGIFPILPSPSPAVPIGLVNDITVAESQLNLGEIPFGGLHKHESIEGTLIAWVNADTGTPIAAEFSYSVKHSQLKSGSTPPPAFEAFLEALTTEAGNANWLNDHMKTYYVYHPPES